jgi:hypothetical protein
MELDIASANKPCSDIACIGIGGVMLATTGIISGSIVLAGNTIHWLEKQGKCDDGLVTTYVEDHNKPLLENNGKLIQSDSSETESTEN